jgi:PAS domain S-box-containing protein
MNSVSLKSDLQLNVAVILTAEQFDNLQHVSSIGVWVMDYSTGKSAWTDEALRIYGLPLGPNTYTYEEWLEFIHPEDKHFVLGCIENPQPDGRIVFDARIVRPDGTIRYVKQVTTRQYDAAGHETGMYGICQDITEQALLAAQLHTTIEDLERYKMALDSSSIVSVTDSAGIITYANEGFCRISKYTGDELTGASHSIINSGYHTSAFWAAFWSTISAGEVWKGIVKNKAKDGTFYWVDTTVVPFKEENGTIKNYISIRHDITELQQVRVELEQKNNLLQGTLQEMQQKADFERKKFKVKEQIFAAADEHAIVSSLLHSLSEMKPLSFMAVYIPESGYDENSWVVCVDSANENVTLEKVSNRLARNYVVEQTGRFCQAGTAAPKIDGCTDIAIPLNSAESSTIGWIVLGCIDSMKKTEEEMAWLKELSELICLKIEQIRGKRFIEHSNEILKAEVNKQTAELREINQGLEMFAATIAHDLRAPLRNISGFVGLLKETLDGKADDEQVVFMDHITSSAKRMGDLIVALLQFSRLSKQKLNKEVFNPLPMVKNIVSGMQQQYPDKQFEVSVDISNRIHADRVLIGQVFENLVSNAFKYSAGRDVIKVAIKQQVVNGECVFTVSDNGAGFDSRYAEKLFKPFGRLHSNSEFEGTGIGLASCKWIINAHGGDISACSEVDKGTTFRFTLPCKDNPVTEGE